MMPTSFPSGILSFLIALLTPMAFCRAQGFVETFSGTGPHASTGVILEGFDNPGWFHDGNGMFRDGGLWFENDRLVFELSDGLQRSVAWSKGFKNTVEIRDHVLTSLIQDGEASISFRQGLGGNSTALDIDVLARDGISDPYSVFLSSGREFEWHSVEPGPHVLLSISFDEDTSQVTYEYDNNLDDAVPPITVATMAYTGTVNDEELTTLVVTKTGFAQADALVDHWTFMPFSFTGDFNANGTFDAGDIDLLNGEIRRGTNDPDFDLVEDGIVDEFDRNFWVHSLNNTYFGDANLDGEFNSGDLVAVFQAGHYEDGIALNSGWAEGDWNGNGDFESGDLIVAFQDGGYEVGPRAAAAVPEPSSLAAFVAGLIGPVVSNCRRRAV